MKTCPICNTTLFDDMDVCYGCMYSFGSKPELERKAQEAASASAPVTEAIERAETVHPLAVPAQGEPSDDAAGGEPLPLALLNRAATAMPGWGIRFEMHDEAAPHRIWSMELTPPRAAAAG